MDYKLDYTDKGEYTHFVVEGKDSLETTRAFWTEVYNISKRKGYFRVLVEEHLEGQLTPAEMFEVCQELPELMRGIPLRIAHVDVVSEHLVDNELGETVAHNRGMEVKVFDNLDNALDWLLERA